MISYYCVWKHSSSHVAEAQVHLNTSSWYKITSRCGARGDKAFLERMTKKIKKHIFPGIQIFSFCQVQAAFRYYLPPFVQTPQTHYDYVCGRNRHTRGRSEPSCQPSSRSASTFVCCIFSFVLLHFYRIIASSHLHASAAENRDAKILGQRSSQCLPDGFISLKARFHKRHYQ